MAEGMSREAFGAMMVQVMVGVVIDQMNARAVTASEGGALIVIACHDAVERFGADASLFGATDAVLSAAWDVLIADREVR